MNGGDGNGLGKAHNNTPSPMPRHGLMGHISHCCKNLPICFQRNMPDSAFALNQYVLRFNVTESGTVAFAESGCKVTTKIWNMQVLSGLNGILVRFCTKIVTKNNIFSRYVNNLLHLQTNQDIYLPMSKKNCNFAR